MIGETGSYTFPLAMDYYNGESYHLQQDMIDPEMDISTEMYHGYQTHELTKHSPLSIPSHPSPQDGYIEVNHSQQINYNTSDAHMQAEYKLSAPTIPLHLKTEPSELEAADNSLSWYLPQQHSITCNHTAMVKPPSPITNGAQSVPNQSLSSKILSLPNSVQISGGNVNYVSMASPTQQVYITTTKATMATHQQPSLTDTLNHAYRPRTDSNFMLSPNSVPTSTVVDNPYPKPPYSYSCLIAMALKNSKQGSLPVAEIYNFMIRHFPYFKTAPDGWKNSVRHNLSLNKCFEKIENPNADGTNSRKGCLWALNPAKMKKMDEEIFKWNKKDAMGIKRAMVHPEMLDTLSQGQELHIAGNGMKHVHGSIHQPVHMHPALHQQQQSLLHMHHHAHQQSQSPHHSPTLGIINNHQAAMMSQSNGYHNVPVMHTQGHHGGQVNLKQVNGHPEADVYNGDELDPLLAEINVQNGIWDELPNDLLEIPYSNSPTAFLISPKKTGSPDPSPANDNTSRGTLVPLGQN